MRAGVCYTSMPNIFWSKPSEINEDKLRANEQY